MSLVRPQDWVQQGIDSLEDRAWLALRETERSVCVTAGAGAGKTEFLAQKAAYLLQTGLCPHPKRILAISFKRDAAQNLSERLRKRCPDQGHRFVSLTFDAFTKSLVDQFRDAIPDRFRPPSNYEIFFPTKDATDDFLARHNARDVTAQTFERAVTNTRLPLDALELPPRTRGLLEAYWQEQYANPERTFLSFAMLNRLAEILVRENGQIRKALLATYPVVFLDEFQDTTTAQYELLAAIFHGSSTKLTAVGDDKQRIMGWAGAMRDSFGRFSGDFNARPITLLSNWRSHGDLVAVQHLIASRIDPAVEAAVARQARRVDGDVAAIWQFRSRADEVDYIADWIAGEIRGGEIEPHQIAILVRNYADRVEQEIAPPLQENGVVVRNVARNVGGVAIQDLLAEELTELLLPFLRLGVKKRDAAAWSSVQSQMQSMEAIFEDDDTGLHRLRKLIENICRVARDYMRAHEPGGADVSDLVTILINEIGEQRLRRTTPSYGRQADFDRVRSGFTALLEECCRAGGTWAEVLDRFEGIGQVPLMTVHKSKGLEFHTMVFFGLDDRSWWSLTPSNAEELNSFFVAFTRAEQRAFFTCCRERGGGIAWLEQILGDAVPRQSPG